MPPFVSRVLAPVCSLSVIAMLVLAVVGCGSTPSKPQATLPPGSSGSVNVLADNASYRTTQPIGVTIRNSSKTTYYVQAGQSECTPLQMQVQVGTTWQNVMPCLSGELAQAAAVTPGLVEPFTFAPGNAADDHNAWAPGVYRFVLQLTTSANGSGATTLVYSPGIRIVAPS